eukprot:m.124846 g.124846  ORF g.124846 m.124846 type:complete len:240 (+) comp19761_c0_seq1:121-840(+)
MADTRQPWFFGRISKAEADRFLLKPEVEEGSFLLRESTSDSGSYTLSVRVGSAVRNFRLNKTQGMYHVGDGERFPNLTTFVNAYMESGIMSDGKTVSLNPCTKPGFSNSPHSGSVGKRLSTGLRGLAPAGRALPPPPAAARVAPPSPRLSVGGGGGAVQPPLHNSTAPSLPFQPQQPAAQPQAEEEEEIYSYNNASFTARPTVGGGSQLSLSLFSFLSFLFLLLHFLFSFFSRLEHISL